MSRFRLIVEPRGSLFIGGYSQAVGASDGDTALDLEGYLLPGSAVKGALREAAARLVNGAGRGQALLEGLFGTDGKPGVLRVGTLRPVPLEGGDPSALPAPSIRFHVSLERATRQAAPQRLFQNRVTPALTGLRFAGELTPARPLSDDELGLLRSAVRLADQLGGGRGRGLGAVEMELEELADAAVEGPRLEGSVGDGSLLLVLEAAEPIHLAGVKDPSNYTASQEHLDGSVLRGAVAAVLASWGREGELETVVAGAEPVIFGDARPGGAETLPAPMTLRVPKRGGAPSDVAALLCAEACGGAPRPRELDVRTAQGTWVRTGGEWVRYPVVRRTVTRTARDIASGRAADGRLYSLEVLDPVVAPMAGAGGRLRFWAPVMGTAEQLALVVSAAGRGLVVGGDRSRGFGRLRLVEVVREEPLEPLTDRHARWAEMVGRLGVERPESTGVIITLGPVALDQERFLGALAALGLEVREGVARRRSHGGWNSAIELPRTVTSQLLPGSTFVVVRPDGASALPALARLEREGLGPGRPDGWGRLVACHPIHVDCPKEEGS